MFRSSNITPSSFLRLLPANVTPLYPLIPCIFSFPLTLTYIFFFPSPKPFFFLTTFCFLTA